MPNYLAMRARREKMIARWGTRAHVARDGVFREVIMGVVEYSWREKQGGQVQPDSRKGVFSTKTGPCDPELDDYLYTFVKGTDTVDAFFKFRPTKHTFGPAGIALQHEYELERCAPQPTGSPP
jgi:hypothetical protein